MTNRQEVRLVEDVQNVQPELEVRVADHLRALREPEVGLLEARSGDDQRSRRAIAVTRGAVHFDAVRAVRWREIPAGGWRTGVARRRGRAGVERRNRVVDDVLRQCVHMASDVVEPELEHLLEVAFRHPDGSDVAEVHELAAADDRCDPDLPAAEDAVDDAVRAAADPVSLAERQIVDDVQLEGARDVAGIARLAKIDLRPPQRQEIRRELMAEDVVRLRLQTAGKPPPQLELQRVVPRRADAARHVRAGQRVRVDHEEIGGQAGGERVGAERRVADEPVLPRGRAATGRGEAGEREWVRVPSGEEREVVGVRPVAAGVPARVTGLGIVRAVEVREEDRQRRGAGRAGVRKGVTPAGRNVCLQVRLCLPELAQEPVLEDIELVVVLGHPRVVRPRADIPDLNRRVAIERALEAYGKRIGGRDLDIRREAVHRARERRRNRINRRRRERGRGH